MARPKVRELLSELGSQTRRLTNEILDELPADKTLARMRSVLVAIGALPARDERLLKLERWITAAISAREDPSERKILHGYAIWHHVRRLRQRLGTTHATHLQVVNVRCHVTAAASFPDWLATEGLALSSCTQPDLDRWASGEDIAYRDETAHFVRWSVARRHASHLTFGAVRWEGPRGPHDSEKRWNDARRLLRDSTLTTSDRVAGLLLLLYAQRITSIVKLTTGHIHDHGDRVEIMLGTAPGSSPRTAGRPGPGTHRHPPGSRRHRTSRHHTVAVSRRTPRPAHRRRPARNTAEEHRPAPPPGQIHRPVHPRRRDPRRDPRPHARHPHPGRRPMATRISRGLDDLRRRGQPPPRQGDRTVTPPRQQAIILITGIQAAGKSTIAQMLAERLPRSVHVRGDLFRRMVINGRADMTPGASEEAVRQLRLRHRLTAATCDEYFQEGFTVVAQDVILGEHLTEMARLIRQRPLLVVVLAPRPEAIAAREAARGKNAYSQWTIDLLDNGLRNETPRLGLWLDTSDQTPDDTINEILTRAWTEANVQ